jgi:hypothetical protein
MLCVISIFPFMASPDLMCSLCISIFCPAPVAFSCDFSLGLRSCVPVLDFGLRFSFVRAQCVVRFWVSWFSCAPADLVFAGSLGPTGCFDFRCLSLRFSVPVLHLLPVLTRFSSARSAQCAHRRIFPLPPA